MRFDQIGTKYVEGVAQRLVRAQTLGRRATATVGLEEGLVIDTGFGKALIARAVVVMVDAFVQQLLELPLQPFEGWFVLGVIQQQGQLLAQVLP
ncbi:hypothetical protein D3C79_717720 [compost metagenome]